MATTAAYSFSYAPKPQAALASLAPVTFGEGLRFSRQTPLEMRDQRPEAVAEGFYKGQQQLVEGISTGILSGLGKVVDAYTTRRQKEIDKKEQENQSEIEHKRAVEIAQIKAAKTPEEIQEATLSRDIKQKQLEKLSKEVDDRIEDTVPEGVRKRGFFNNPDFGKRPEEIVEPALPTQGGASISPTNSATAIAGIDYNLPAYTGKTAVKTPTGGASISPTDAAKALAGMPEIDIPEPDVTRGTLEALPAVMVPAQSAGKLALQGEELDLMPISTQPNAVPMVPSQTGQTPTVATTPPAQPAAPAAPAAQEPQQSWSQYEFEYQYAGAPYESLADAKYASGQMKSVGYNTKIVTAGTATNPIFYIEYDRPDEVQTPSAPVTPQGMQVKAIKDVDGKREITYEPSIPKEQQIEMLKAPLQSNDTMLKAIKQIRSIYRGISPGTGLIGSIMQWIPGSDAADVRNLLKALKGNIAFKALADMRKASPTGGAVGAVSERELGLLESTLGAIDADLSEFLFTQNLNEIERILTEYNKGAAQKIKEIEKPQNFQSIQSPENRIKITSKEEWNKLKPGQKYDFNGSLGTKK